MHGKELRSAEAETKEMRDALIESLAEKASRGDDDALYTLCERIASRVIFYATKLLGGNAAEAEDVAQESLLYLCEKIGDLREAKAFKVWLNKIVSNKARDHFRKNAQRATVYNLDDYVSSLMEEKRDHLPVEYAESEEIRQLLAELVDALPPRQYEVIFLYYYEGFRVNEIAEIMNVDQSAVSRYLALAREKLRKGMEKQQNGSGLIMTAFSIDGLLYGVFDWKVQGDIAANSDLTAHVLLKCRKIIDSQATMTQEASAARWKPLIAPLLAIAATAAISITTVFLSLEVKRGADAAPAIVASGTEIQIEFSGGEYRGKGNAHLNPTAAYVQTGDGSTVTVIEWWITPVSDEGEILYRGLQENSVELSAAFATLRKQGDGVYMIWFAVQDQAGLNYHNHRSFRIDSG